MGKSKKRNAFFCFMQERKPEVERSLKKQITLAEMPQYVTAEWQALPEAQKNKYRSMCGDTREKLDCRGVPLRQLQERAEDRRGQAEDMKKDIADIIDVLHQGNAVHQATFYLVSANCYVATDLDHHVPAELSILQFSFKKGIIREFHETASPFIPRCYGASARRHCQDTHNLEHEPDKSHGKTLDEVAHNLKHFLGNDWEENVPLYTLRDDMEMTKQILETITGDEYKIYSLDMLYQYMYSAAIRAIPLSVAKELITECGLDYHPNLSCPWHITNQEDSARFCSLSTGRRWFFFMCQHIDLKKSFGVVPRPGKHYPDVQPEEGIPRSFSSLTLEDTGSERGAAGFGSWTKAGRKGK